MTPALTASDPRPDYDAGATLERAIGLYDRGLVDQAEELGLELALGRASSVQAMEMVTTLALGRCDFPRCEALARRGLKRFPDSYQIHLDLARALIYQHRLPEATALLLEMTRRFAPTQVVAWELSTILTWQGRWEEALDWQALARRLDPSLPDYSELHRYMTDSVRRAEAETSARDYSPSTLFGLPLWGESFLEAFLNLGLPSLLHPSNLPALAERRRPIFRFYSDPRGVMILDRAPGLRALRRLARVELESVPQLLFTWNGATITGWLHHLTLHLAQAMKADCCLLYAEGIFSQGSLGYLAQQMDQGDYDAVVSQGINLNRQGLELVLRHRSRGGGAFGLPARELIDIVLTNMSSRTSDYVLTDPKDTYSADPSNLIYSDGQALRMRTLQPLPYYISRRILRHGNQYNYCYADHGLLDALFPDPRQFSRIKWAGHSDDFLCVGVDWAPQRKRDKSAQRVSLTQMVQRVRNAFATPARVWAFQREILYQGNRPPAWPAVRGLEPVFQTLNQALWAAGRLRKWRELEARQGLVAESTGREREKTSTE